MTGSPGGDRGLWTPSIAFPASLSRSCLPLLVERPGNAGELVG